MLGFKKKDTRQREKLLAIVRETDLPSFPKLALETVQAIRDPDVQTERLAAMVERDMGLVVSIFRLVNSAAFGTAHPIASVHHAISFLGRARLEQVVLSLLVRDTLPKEPAPGFTYARHWTTAFFRAALCRHLAGALHPSSEAMSFTSGLLQDLAIPVLAHALPQEYGRVLNAWHQDARRPLDELERGEFGWSHAEVGMWIGAEWGLPEELVTTISRHHSAKDDPECLPAVRLVAMLHEGDVATSREMIVEEARAAYGLDPNWMLGVLDLSAAQAGELAGQLR